MSSSEASQDPKTPAGRPTERDLDRLTTAVRSAGRERGFRRRVIDRYQQWIFLFVGWCLKAPPGDVSRERIGDFWAALSEHPGTGKARICEAMDALGFFFGHLQREARLLFFPEGTGGEEAPPQAAAARSNAGFSRPNPSLRIRGTKEEGPPSTEVLSNRQLSRYLPSGTLPEEADARAEIPKQEISQREGPREGPRETTQEASKSREERGPRDAPVTLFNPQGRAQNPDTSASSNPSHEPISAGESASPASDQDDVQSEGEPEDEGEHQEQADLDRVPVQIPETVADRLEKAARRLGLPPSVFAARAIELVCDDAGIERLEPPSAESPLERYQTQLDLLQLQRERAEAPSTGGETPVEGEDERAAQVEDPEDRTSGSDESGSEDARSDRAGHVGKNRSAGESASSRGNEGRDPGPWGNAGASGGDGRGGAVSESSL